MEIRTREEGDVVIVDLDGPLVAGVGDRILRQSMNELVVEGWEKILLNLSQVTRIDSTGVGELVASIKLAKRFGGSVKLVKIGSKVKHILNLSRILPLLEFFEDEADALKEFAAEAGRTRD
jgi:anti-sigma B factor antagonist